MSDNNFQNIINDGNVEANTEVVKIIDDATYTIKYKNVNMFKSKIKPILIGYKKVYKDLGNKEIEYKIM